MNELTYDKPFKTYEELIEIMESRHIEIQNKNFAIQALQNFSYYGIVNGYKNSFLQIPGTDNFIPGTKFEELYTLHIIDSSLNNIIFKYILFLEKALKSRLSYLISKKYGVYTDPYDDSFNNPNDYLYYKYYKNHSNKRINVLRSLKEYVSKPQKNPIMIHYITNKNHIPPWILTTNISYGLTIEWYNILSGNDKANICNSFVVSDCCSSDELKEFTRKAFEITKEYRNKIAHGNRTFNILSLPQLPKKQLLSLSYNTVSANEYDQKMGQDDTTAVILALFIMLNDPYVAANFLKELRDVLEPYHSSKFNGKTIYDIFGFPGNLFQRLKHFGELKYN